MRSVKESSVAAGSCLLTVGILAGCHTTTQQTSARLGVQAKRTLAGQKPIVVAQPDRSVRVVRTSVVRGGGGGTALVALLRNPAKHPVNDLPLAAGVRKPGGPPDYVNVKGASYWQAHTPAIPPRGEVTWVLASSKALTAGTPVAAVGEPKGPLPAKPQTLPKLDVTAKGDAKGAVKASISNTSGIPQ